MSSLGLMRFGVCMVGVRGRARCTLRLYLLWDISRPSGSDVDGDSDPMECFLVLYSTKAKACYSSCRILLAREVSSTRSWRAVTVVAPYA